MKRLFPSKQVINKALALIESNSVKLIVFQPGTPFMEFKIGDNTITFNHSGWLCDSLESDDTINKRKNHHDRWSCALNVNKYVCSHILACMLLLVSIGLWCDAFRYANGFPESKVDLKTILGDING